MQECPLAAVTENGCVPYPGWGTTWPSFIGQLTRRLNSSLVTRPVITDANRLGPTLPEPTRLRWIWCDSTNSTELDFIRRDSTRPDTTRKKKIDEAKLDPSRLCPIDEIRPDETRLEPRKIRHDPTNLTQLKVPTRPDQTDSPPLYPTRPNPT